MVVPQEFELFYREFYPSLYRFVFIQTGAPEADVEDIVQETLVHAWKGRKDFLGSSTPETWIMAIARHKAADYWRRRSRDEARLAASVEDALAKIDQAAIPEDLLQTGEMRRRVAAALEGVDPSYATVLRLHYLEGHSVRAIARDLNESESAVESRLTRARESFRKKLGAKDE